MPMMNSFEKQMIPGSSGNGSNESDNSDEFECQAQFEVDQYCENKDELQHDDEQEEEMNHGQTNTQTKDHIPKPGPRNEPIPWGDRIRDLRGFKRYLGTAW